MEQQRPIQEGFLPIAVCGAHLTGLPLNYQLVELGAIYHQTTLTSPKYHMFALAHQELPKPGMFRSATGTNLEVEVWEMPISRVGAFLSLVKHPLSLGEIELEDGTWVHGFICNPYIAQEGEEISTFGGWRQYLVSKSHKV